MKIDKLICKITHDYEHQETLEDDTGVFKCRRCGDVKTKKSTVPKELFS